MERSRLCMVWKVLAVGMIGWDGGLKASTQLALDDGCEYNTAVTLVATNIRYHLSEELTDRDLLGEGM